MRQRGRVPARLAILRPGRDIGGMRARPPPHVSAINGKTRSAFAVVPPLDRPTSKRSLDTTGLRIGYARSGLGTLWRVLYLPAAVEASIWNRRSPPRSPLYRKPSMMGNRQTSIMTSSTNPTFMTPSEALPGACGDHDAWVRSLECLGSSHPLMRLTWRTHSGTSALRSRQIRRQTSSSGVGTLTIEQTRGSPRLYAINVRISASPSIRSFFARRCRRDTAIDAASTT